MEIQNQGSGRGRGRARGTRGRGRGKGAANSGEMHRSVSFDQRQPDLLNRSSGEDNLMDFFRQALVDDHSAEVDGMLNDPDFLNQQKLMLD